MRYVKQLSFFFNTHICDDAAIAQLGERQTEDLKVPGSIPGGGKAFVLFAINCFIRSLWRNWIAHPSPKGKVAGSTPVRDTIKFI